MPNRRIPRPGAARQGEPIGAGFVRGGGRGAARQEAVIQAREAAAQQQEAAHQAWVQRFVQMALNDEEDQLEWDSDDEEDAAAWEIPVRWQICWIGQGIWLEFRDCIKKKHSEAFDFIMHMRLSHEELNNELMR
jgi:hypothetical protein